MDAPMTRPMNNLRQRSTKTPILLASGIAALGLLLSISSGLFYFSQNAELLNKRELDDEMETLSQSVGKNAIRANQGDKDAIQKLDADKKAFSSDLAIQSEFLPFWFSSKEEMTAAISNLNKDWKNAVEAIDIIVNVKQDIQNSPQKISEIQKDLIVLRKNLDIVAQSTDKEVYDNQRQYMRVIIAKLDQMNVLLENTLANPDLTQDQAKQFSTVANELAVMFQNLEKTTAPTNVALFHSPELRTSLNTINKLLSDTAVQKDLVLSAGVIVKIQKSKDLGSYLYDLSDVLLKDVQAMTKAHKNMERQLSQFGLAPLLGIILMALALAYYFYAQNKDDNYRIRLSQAENEKNVKAVWKLLTDIQGLGGGDLTKQATVSNGITKEIALKLNSTVNDLRNLVLKVRGTTMRVMEQSEKSGELSSRLVETSRVQGQRVDKISEDISKLATEMNDISGKSKESYNLADKALVFSEQGAAVVENTISDMNNIRESIQETSKRIKALGEASQEIGDVILLIRNIGTKIFVLAMNAELNAASAGEAGKIFTVVAEEVRALSNEAQQATKTIEGLVDSIQSQAKLASATMENATQRVVTGARTADAAGQSLQTIGNTAEELKSMVEDITNRMREGSAHADVIVSQMETIKTFTTEARERTLESQEAVEKMKVETRELISSVEGFRLDAKRSSE